MTQLRKKPSDTAQRSYSGPTPAATSATRKAARPHQAAFAPEVFASAAEYDQSVASVVARIQSGQAPPRPPDE
ncbi:hypothetical protein [Hymenobacter terricola]|uniref:hypothetical protein n=1 Tax=Hymenobacter terricola TaxID=2819236 RepID=UPI001B313DA9|nr:hypothetical protein [Hymenobacter terricola]